MSTALTNPFLSLTALIMCIATALGCAHNTSSRPNSSTSLPAHWSTGYTMQGLLDNTSITLNNTNDLPKLLSLPWYASISVSGTINGDSELSNCKEYFSQSTASTRTLKNNEMSAFLEFKVMCQATKLLINALDSEKSYLPQAPLSEHTPNLWPKQFALQISTNEAERNSQNPKLTSWADITPITRYEPASNTKSVYSHDGGFQELEILGYGDFNNDEVEDIAILVRDHVEQGTYFNLRLFVLSVDQHGTWKIIQSL